MLLAIDTATRMTGLALHDGSSVLAEHIWVGGGHHTTQLAPEVGLMLRRLDVEPSSLKAVAVASGPGSYTGLRIGMAFGKGMALAHGIPLIGIPTLDILVRGQPTDDDDLLALIEAGRGRLAGVWYNKVDDRWTSRTEAEPLTIQEAVARVERPTYVCGEISPEGRRLLQSDRRVTLAPPALCVRRPSILAEMAYERLTAGKQPDPAAVVPTYLAPAAGSGS